jgi:hypothetical protein
MKGSEVKKIVLKDIEPFFIGNGYKKVEMYEPSPAFIKKDMGFITEVGFHFISDGDVGFSKMQLSIDAVEDIIIEIGIPNHTLEEYKAKELAFLITIKDTKTQHPNQIGNYVKVETEKDALEYAEWVINYIQNTGLPFAEYYSHLPNVLSEMNRLEAEGKYWNGIRGSGGILNGGSDSFFRGLIISKLCNDPDFSRKLKMMDEKFYERNDKWLPYYEKLKARLEYLQPMYNV